MAYEIIATGKLPMWLEPRPDAARLVTACRTLGQAGGHLPTAAHAAVMAADLMSCSDATSMELGRCWLWVAASQGSRLAAAGMARLVADRAHHEAAGLPASALVVLLQTWLASSSPQLGHHEDEEIVFEEDVDHYGDGFFVSIPLVGDPGSREGKEISKRLSHVVGVPLPLKGRIPAPGAVEREFAAVFPWAKRYGRYLEGQMSLLRSSGAVTPRLPPQLLVGPAGCGKTTMLQWIADRCGLPAVTIPIGGTSDSAGLAAVSRGWLTAQPCTPVSAMMDFAAANPVIILDELEKGVSEAVARNGSVTGALLAMLKPPADGYRDTFLMANVHLDHVTFLASANSLLPLSEPLRQRFVIHPIPGPSLEHFAVIMPGVISNEARRLGIQESLLPYFGHAEKKWLRSVYEASNCSIRSLEQAFQVMLGELAADEAMAMQRPH